MNDSLEIIVSEIRKSALSLHYAPTTSQLKKWADRLAALPKHESKIAATQTVFDCTLRAVNDLNASMGHWSLQYAPQWIAGWAALLRDAGFTPTNPDAGDIKRGLAKLPPPPTVDEREVES